MVLLAIEMGLSNGNGAIVGPIEIREELTHAIGSKPAIKASPENTGAIASGDHCAASATAKTCPASVIHNPCHTAQSGGSSNANESSPSAITRRSPEPL